MQIEEELRIKFRQDFRAIALDFIEDYGLRYQEEAENLADPELRWIDFVLRYIPQNPRQVIRSHGFPADLDGPTESAIREMEDRFEQGIDVNPYQSKGLIFFNDTSGLNEQKRTDLLWADWGIHHLHLPEHSQIQKGYFSPRSKALLLCLVLENEVAFIDVKSHGEGSPFSEQDLLEEMVASWPEFMESYRLKGILLALPKSPYS